MKEILKDMPWGGIAKRTLQGAGVTFTLLTALAFDAIRNEHKIIERNRTPRWTDAARWEK